MYTRVREALNDPDFCRKLRGKIPKDALQIPEELLKNKTYYPLSLMKLFPDDNTSYSYLGIVAECMLQEPIIDENSLQKVVNNVCNIEIQQKTLKLATTQRFIQNIKNTKTCMDNLIDNSTDIRYNERISIEECSIEGHPDIFVDCGSQIFEVKTSGQIKKNWVAFLLQTFSYAALCSSSKKIHIVLPLSEFVWSWDVENSWPKRKLFVDVLKSYGKKEDGKPAEDPYFEDDILYDFKIGYHVGKKRNMADTVSELFPTIPYQIFLTKSTKFDMKDADMEETLRIVNRKKIHMYIHAPYLLNLCLEPGETDNYVVECINKHLICANLIGSKGVVVHVGKSCNRESETAHENMIENIKRCIQNATQECPLLLETPAGQGSEMLTNLEEFMGFVDNINDQRFGMCIDTCHVFAAGCQPLDYIKRVVENEKWRKHLRLIHFNDSRTKCGSCVDRHSQLGMGWIDKKQLLRIAIISQQWNIPMLTE